MPLLTVLLERIIRRNLNPDTSGTDTESRNDDAPKEDMTLKESLKSASCDDDVGKEDILKKSYRSEERNNPH